MAYADLRGINPLQDITARLHDAGGMGYSVKSQGALGFLGAQARGLARSVAAATTINSTTVTGNALSGDVGSYFLIQNAGGAFLTGSSISDGGYPSDGPAPHLFGTVVSVVAGVSWTISLNAGVTIASTTIYLSTVNDYAAFVATAGKVQAAGGGSLDVEPDLYFIVFPSTTTPYSNIVTGGASLYLHDLSGVAINAPGALIVDVTAYSDIVSGPGTAFLEINNCRNVLVDIGCLCSQIMANFAGCIFIRIQGSSKNVLIKGERQGGLMCARITSFGLGGNWATNYGPQGVVVLQHTVGTVYPLFVEGLNIKNVWAELSNIGAYRDFYLFGCSNVDVICDSIAQRGVAQIICDSLDYVGITPTKNVRVKYHCVFNASSATGGNGAINIGFKGQTAGKIQNLDIHVDIEQLSPGTNSGLPGPSIITLGKTNNVGAPDSTGRGHVLDGFRLSGRVQYDNPAFVTLPTTYMILSTIGAFASPDIIRNFRVEDFQVLTTTAEGGSVAGFYLDLGAALQDTAIARHVQSAGPFQVYATSAPGEWLIDESGLAANVVTNNGVGRYSGSGTPAGVVTAQPGSVYQNFAGGSATSLYVKESGANTNTGWVGK